jgi:hypothetical protein
MRDIFEFHALWKRVLAFLWEFLRGNRNVVNRSRCDRIDFVYDLFQIMPSSLFNFLGWLLSWEGTFHLLL